MGEVLLAEQTGLSGFGKKVALKRIRGDLAHQPSYVEMFLNEARTSSFLNHPHIVHVFDVGRTEDSLYIVMEYVDGIDLKRLHRRMRLGGKALATYEVVEMALQVLSALEVAHRGARGDAPIIHRDLSPENIIVTRSGQAKVLDFGLAKWWPSKSKVPSLENGLIFGKVRYMPPEQLRGDFIDPRADLFSLGVVIYEALTSALPFGRGDATEMLSRILSGPPKPLVELNPEVSPALDSLVMRALSAHPDDRPESAAQMRQALVDIARSLNEVLPLERIRGILQRFDSDPVSVSHLPASEWSPTQVSLPVVQRCGKCGGPSQAFIVDDIILDQCQSCHGIWVDKGELQRIFGEGLPTATNPAAPTEGMDHIPGSCPLDRVGLVRLDVPGEGVAFEVCPVCKGMWFDRDELRLLSKGDVVQWLQSELASL